MSTSRNVFTVILETILSWFKKEEKPQSLPYVKPAKGICLFPYNQDLTKAAESLQPQYVRLCISNETAFHSGMYWATWFQNKGVKLILQVWDKTDPYKTIPLAIEYGHRLNNTIIEIGNENNCKVDYFISPKDYPNFMKDCYTRIKSATSCEVMFGGLNNEIKKKSDREIPAWDYLEEFFKAGGNAWTDYINFHNYTIDNRFYRLISLIRRYSKKPIVCTEFGTRDKGNIFKREYDMFMKAFGLNGVKIAVLYQWSNDDGFGISPYPELIDYIRNY